MGTTSGHFCAHGNLRYACPTCREERKARRGPIKRKTYGQKLGPRGQMPAKAWRLDARLNEHHQAALQALKARENGVVRLPSPLGLRTLAFAALRVVRHDADNVVFVVPTSGAVAAWGDQLRKHLHVPPDQIDDQGRAVRDWARLRPVVIWSPEGLRRNRSGLIAHAKKLALFVDSPESDAYAGLYDIFARPFARRVGVSAARLGPEGPNGQPGCDALGGVVFDRSVREAIQAGDLRRVDADLLVAKDPLDAAIERVARIGSSERAILVVDDAAAGRAAEERLARAGIEPRFVADVASAEAARRAAEAVRAGSARVMVRTPGAPPTPCGSVSLLVRASHDLAPGRGAAELLALLGQGDQPLVVVEAIPEAAPSSPDAIARRVRDLAALGGRAVPPLPWIWDALGVPRLPDHVAARVSERAAGGWQDLGALLPDALEAGLETHEAWAALADAFIAARRGVAPYPLGPASMHPAAALDMPIPLAESLPALALHLAEAERAYAAYLRGDLAGTVAAFAAAPVLHHLVPEIRRVLLATAQLEEGSRLPAFDAEQPKDAALTLLCRGPSVTLPSGASSAPEVPLEIEAHRERLLRAIGHEKELEEAESVAEIERLTGPERQRLGRTLLGLELVAKARTDRGVEARYAAPAGPSRARPPLPYTELQAGALVSLSIGDVYAPVARGVVAAVTEDEVRVVVEEDRERRAPGRDARIDLVGNPRVYDLLARAASETFSAGGRGNDAATAVRDHLLLRATPHHPKVDALRLYSAELDDTQQAAVARTVAAPHVALVHGPPGTGKTTTLVEVIRQEVARGHRVLVAADSNAAVDAVLDAFHKAGGLGVRTGPRPSLTRPHLAGLHIDTLRARAPGVDWLQRIPVTFTTHVSSASLPRAIRYDVVVQDEASQATEPASCLSLSRGARLVLAGDHLQLPPVVRSDSARDEGLDVSLFERMQRAYGGVLGTLLSVQYRMHPDIEEWSSRQFYEGRIRTAVDPAPVGEAVRAGLLPANPRALFVDVEGAEHAHRTSKAREAEVAWIDGHVRALLAAGVRPGQIAVIAAYRAQVRLLRDALRGTDVDIGTIDAFQGSERDIVIVSLVRSNIAGEVGFVRDPRRLNVAVTRARRHLLVVGDPATLTQTPLLADLLAHLAPYGAAESAGARPRADG